MNYFRAFESAKSVYILLLNAFVSFAFFLLAIIINEADHFNQGFLNSFSDFFLFSFWQQFSVFSVLHLIIYTITFILITEVFLFLCKIVTQFDCSRRVYSLIFVLSSPSTTPWNTICWIALGSASKAFFYLRQLQLIFNYLWNTHNLKILGYNHPHALLIPSWFHHIVLSSH